MEYPRRHTSNRTHHFWVWKAVRCTCQVYLSIYIDSRAIRTCVGMHLADQSLFIIMATMLWAFDIKPAVDEKGKEVVPSPDDLVVLGAVV